MWFAPAGWKAERLKAPQIGTVLLLGTVVPDQGSSRTWARLVIREAQGDARKDAYRITVGIGLIGDMHAVTHRLTPKRKRIAKEPDELFVSIANYLTLGKAAATMERKVFSVRPLLRKLTSGFFIVRLLSVGQPPLMD
jgi:hypothetical protein